MVHHSPGAHSLPGAERCRSTLRHGSAISNQGPVPLVLPSLSSTAPPSTGMQGAHARPIVAQLTPGDPRPIAAAQNVPAERSGIECREGQPAIASSAEPAAASAASRQLAMMAIVSAASHAATARALHVGHWVRRALYAPTSFRARVFSRFERFVRGVCSACAGSPWVVAFYRVRYGYFMIYRLWVSLPLSLRHTVSHARY